MDTIKTILITNDPEIAADAQAAGVTRIMVDLESAGKKERQASRATFISSHGPDDIAKIRAVLTTAELIVRINPWHDQSSSELEHVVNAGADIVMLPMITALAQLEQFTTHLAGRVMPLPLIETAYSMAHIGAIAAHPAFTELYIGLNDLHLSLGLDFLFEPLALGLLDWMAQQIKAQNKPFGFGGIAAMGSGELPAEYILAEHARLGSGCVILSSRFCKDIAIGQKEGRKERLGQAIAQLQNTHRSLLQRSNRQQQEEAARTISLIKTLADNIRKGRKP